MPAILLNDGKVLLRREDERYSLPEAQPESIVAEGEKFDFEIEGKDYTAVGVTGCREIEGMEWIGVRDSWSRLDAGAHCAVGKGSELVFWARNNRFCGGCGAEMKRSTEISLKCPECGREIFPSVSPAIIVLVKRDDKALLVHARQFTRPFFGLVAGFVETGETLEQCVAREVKEETSLDITDIRYEGSQPWPYPMQLMIGFTARYAGGEITFADGELTEGGFFDKDHLPPLPGNGSIARRMIEKWIEEMKENINAKTK